MQTSPTTKSHNRLATSNRPSPEGVELKQPSQTNHQVTASGDKDNMTASNSTEIQKNRLVFGLNSRANKTKYDQYAERRSAQEPTPPSIAPLVFSTNQSKQPAAAAASATPALIKSQTPSSTTNEAKEAKENTPLRTTTRANTSLPSTTAGGIRASKYGNYYKPQDLVASSSAIDTPASTQQPRARSTSQERRLKKSVSIHDNEEPIIISNDDASGAPTARDASPSGRTRKVVRRKSITKCRDAREEEEVGDNQANGGGASSTSTPSSSLSSFIPSSQTIKTIPKSKSQDDNLSSTRSSSSTKIDNTNNNININLNSTTRSANSTNSAKMTTTTTSSSSSTNTTTSIGATNEKAPPVARLKFNIPPPPRQVSSSKSSVVDYAKSKIYDSPKHPNNLHKASLNSIPQIISSFKPPKVDVSKAREKWEGGEPFIMANNRRQRNFGKNRLLGTWSVTSVVANQQSQFQQALEGQSALGLNNNNNNNNGNNANNNTGKSSVKQMLARGSVLERVQQFERTPSFERLDIDSLEKSVGLGDSGGANQEGKAAELQSSQVSYKSRISLASDTANTQDLLVGKRESPLSFRRGSLRRQSRSGAGAMIPRFYHPDGKPNTYEIEIQIKNIAACFDKFPDRKAALDGASRSKRFHAIALACGFSEYYKEPLYLYVCHQLKDMSLYGTYSGPTMRRGLAMRKAASVDTGSASATGESGQPKFITCDQFLVCWRKVISSCYDTAARFVHLLTLGQRKYLLPEDFVPLLQSVIEDHPGLLFLRAAPDFHMRYIETVVARIFFCINRSWTGKISLSELRRSNLLAVLSVLSQEEDINQITDYFSYEHFYVIYCKFWTLDQDHDLLISKEDLSRHNDAAISSRIIDRIFLGIVSKQVCKTGKLSYSEFVWFLIAEEDKKHPRSIEYWFRLMDLDGDGFISMYEMEYFYYEQMRRLELMGIEALPFQDCACQILDLVNPKIPNKITLSDLKRSRMTPIFFDTFINLEKYLEHESREFASTRDTTQDGVVVSDWDRYAAEEYELLVSEEGTTTNNNTTTGTGNSL